MFKAKVVIVFQWVENNLKVLSSWFQCHYCQPNINHNGSYQVTWLSVLSRAIQGHCCHLVIIFCHYSVQFVTITQRLYLVDINAVRANWRLTEIVKIRLHKRLFLVEQYRAVFTLLLWSFTFFSRYLGCFRLVFYVYRVYNKKAFYPPDQTNTIWEHCQACRWSTMSPNWESISHVTS